MSLMGCHSWVGHPWVGDVTLIGKGKSLSRVGDVTHGRTLMGRTLTGRGCHSWVGHPWVGDVTLIGKGKSLSRVGDVTHG